MNAPQRIPVKTDTRLDVSYVFDPADRPQSDSLTVMTHGLSHGSVQFGGVASTLKREGVHVARLDFKSNGDNRIGMAEYVRAQHQALAYVQNHTRLRIGSLGAHSMGGKMTKKVKLAHPEWRLPTVYMAPIPEKGAGMAVLRGMKADWKSHVRALVHLNVLELMKTNDQVRKLFFDKDTPTEPVDIVDETRRQMRHTSYRAFVNLLGMSFNHPLRTKIKEPTLLLYSDTDFLFPPESYDDLGYTHPNLKKEHIPGGHDFFIEHAEWTGMAYADFHKRNAA